MGVGDKTTTTNPTSVQSQSTSSAVTPFEEPRKYRILIRRRKGLKLELSEHLKFGQASTDKNLTKHLINIRLEQVNNIITKFQNIQSQLEEMDIREEDFQTVERIEFNEAAC